MIMILSAYHYPKKKESLSSTSNMFVRLTIHKQIGKSRDQLSGDVFSCKKARGIRSKSQRTDGVRKGAASAPLMMVLLTKYSVYEYRLKAL